jgi:hypothetical protein
MLSYKRRHKERNEVFDFGGLGRKILTLGSERISKKPPA